MELNLYETSDVNLTPYHTGFLTFFLSLKTIDDIMHSWQWNPVIDSRPILCYFPYDFSYAIGSWNSHYLANESGDSCFSLPFKTTWPPPGREAFLGLSCIGMILQSKHTFRGVRPSSQNFFYNSSYVVYICDIVFISVSLMPFLGVAKLIRLNNTRIKRVPHQEIHERYEDFECCTDAQYPWPLITDFCEINKWLLRACCLLNPIIRVQMFGCERAQ